MNKVAVLQDLSSFGKCSLTVAIPVLSVMQSQAVPLPTAILTAQTGYESFFYEDFTDKMHHFEEEWLKMGESFAGIYTGFVTGEEQLNKIRSFLKTFKKADTVVLVDPIMGDDGEVYKFYTAALLQRMRELLVEATIITPNVTEACLLTDTDYDALHKIKTQDQYLQAVQEIGQKLQILTPATVIITGIHPPASQKIGNMYFDNGEAIIHLKPYIGASYSGTGDLFASIIMGSVMRGDTIQDAVSLAERFISQAIADTTKGNSRKEAGVNFEKFLKILL